MKTAFHKLFPSFVRSITNSYSQVFFSHNQVFAWILIGVSFFDIYAGLSGLLAVIISNVTAYLVGFNRLNTKAGYYGFNALLVGLGVGVFYQPGPEFFIFLVFVSLLTLFLTIALEGVIGKYGLPYLSVSFLLGIWMATLAARQFSSLQISERGIYTLNEFYMMGGISMVKIYDWFNNLPWHESIKIYFRSLGAIFFQYHLFAGLFMAVGLLIYSRIALILSLLGFYAAYLFYQVIGADISELTYSYIGFNYILTAIAIGGFFTVPSYWSFLWVLLLTPLISVTITSTNALFAYLQLSVFSLPFNLIVLLFLYVMKFRERFFNAPEMVSVQQFSPEDNLYLQQNFKERFGDYYYIPIFLPFFGEWTVTQAHDGEHTHKQDWKHAWDFEILDDEGSAFKNKGSLVEDYYCYNKPIVAPADGWVAGIVDGLEDNQVGDVDLEHNWGNSIVLKHGEQVYSQLSHIKNGSFQVGMGDYVHKGDILAYVGNSGRSPAPHLHFQIQQTPSVGSKTHDYLLCHYMTHDDEAYVLNSFDKPALHARVSNVEPAEGLKKALHFVPGQKIKFEARSPYAVSPKIFNWEVKADIMGNTFIQCLSSGAKAYCKYVGNIHYFTNYVGNQNTLLYYFYLSAYKIAGGYYQGLVVKDKYPVNVIKPKWLVFVQDIIAPFYLFVKPRYQLTCIKSNQHISGSEIQLNAMTSLKMGRRNIKKIDFELYFGNNKLEKFVIQGRQKNIEAIRMDENEN